jgi:hypothetical protein
MMQGVAYGQKLAERYAGHPDVGTSGTFYGADGQLHSVNQTQTIAQTPAGGLQQNAFTGKIDPFSNPSTGPIPAGRAMNAQGQMTDVPSAQPQRFRIPGATGWYVTDPGTGKPVKVADDAVTPDSVFAQQKDFLGSETYKSAINVTNALNSVQRALQSAPTNNGLVDMTTVDNLVRAQTGLSARQGNLQALLSHMGAPAELVGMVNSVLGKGFVPPAQVAQMLTLIRQYAEAEQATAQRELATRNATMNSLSNGAYKDIGVNIPALEPTPDVPWLRPFMPGAQPQAPAGPQPHATAMTQGPMTAQPGMVQQPPMPQPQQRQAPGVRRFNPTTGRLE